MNRRAFLSLTVAGAALVRARTTDAAQGSNVDLVIRGGRVIDPSVRLDRVADIAIANGKIAAVEPSLNAGNAQLIDARGKLVVPGLLDIHTHMARTADGTARVLKEGVTGFVDGGSAGADGIADIVARVRSAPQPGRALLNIGRAGILGDGDTMDLARADVTAARQAITAHRDFIVGVKARLSREVAGGNDLEVLRRAQEVASGFGLPVMIHMGQTISPLGQLLDVLKPGDIVTHMFAPPPNSIVDDSGRVIPEALAARRRGVWFDIGNGQTRHMRWDTIDAIMKAGFWPDTFSTDWTATSPTSGVIDLPNCMSKLFGYGMTVSEAVARATVNPSKIFRFLSDRGTLNVGAPADVAILELREGAFTFLDNYQNSRPGQQRLFPVDAVLAGKRVPRS
jgi:dihydroorotase